MLFHFNVFWFLALLALVQEVDTQNAWGNSHERNIQFKQEQRDGANSAQMQAKQNSKQAQIMMQKMMGKTANLQQRDSGSALKVKAQKKVEDSRRKTEKDIGKIVKHNNKKIEEQNHLPAKKKPAQKRITPKPTPTSSSPPPRTKTATKDSSTKTNGPSRSKTSKPKKGSSAPAKKLEDLHPVVDRHPFLYPTVTHYTACDKTIIDPDDKLNAKTMLEANTTMLYNARIFATTDDLLVFMHVPKTGGNQFYKSTIVPTSKAGLRWMPDPQYGDVPGHRSMNSPGCGPKGTIHCGFSEIDTCIEAGLSHQRTSGCGRLLFVTMLRDPVERILSEYFYGGEHYCHSKTQKVAQWPDEICKIAARNKMKVFQQFDPDTFKEWLHHPDNVARNRQVKHLAASVLSPTEMRLPQCLHMMPRRAVQYWHNKYPAQGKDAKKSSEDQINEDTRLLEEAVNVLRRRFWFVGFTEQFRESVECFKRLTQSKDHSNPTDAYKAHTRTSEKLRDLIPDEINSDILKMNALDVALHDWINAYFKKACFHLSNAFREQYANSKIPLLRPS